MAAPAQSTRRSILGNLFVHGKLDKSTLTGAHGKAFKLELFASDKKPPSPDTFDSARRWLESQDLVRWEKAPGKPYNLMSLGPAWGYAVGVVLGHRSVRCGIADARAEPLNRDGNFLFDAVDAPQLDEAHALSVIQIAAKRVAGLIEQSEVPHHLIRGITIALPSPVDLEGNVANGRILRGLSGRGGAREVFSDELEQAGVSGLHIDIDNDANVAGVGEWHLRQGKSNTPKTLVAVKTSGGIGGALIDERGLVHRGATGAAGELGHIPVDLTALPHLNCGLPPLDPAAVCERCGGVAHLDSYASASSIVDRVFPDGDANGWTDRYKQMLTALFTDSDPDHERVRQAVFDAGWILGRALIPIMEFVDPDLIVIVGRMRSAGAPFTEAVANGLAAQPRLVEHMPDVVASDGTATGILGAVRNTLQNQPPAFPPHLQGTLEQLRRDMRVGPVSWQTAAPMLGPSA